MTQLPGGGVGSLYAMGRIGPVYYGMVWLDMVWYGLFWFGMGCRLVRQPLHWPHLHSHDYTPEVYTHTFKKPREPFDWKNYPTMKGSWDFCSTTPRPN